MRENRITTIVYDRLQRRDNEITTFLYDSYFIYRAKKTSHFKKINKNKNHTKYKLPNVPRHLHISDIHINYKLNFIKSSQTVIKYF